MRSHCQKYRGASLLEILLVMALIVISLSLSVTFIGRSQVSADIKAQTENLAFRLRLAQGNAISGLNNSTHGVHLEPDSYTVFQGDNYNPADPLNLTVELPSTFTIQNIALFQGGSEIQFTAPEGQTTDYGQFNLVAKDVDLTTTITVSQYGTISY